MNCLVCKFTLPFKSYKQIAPLNYYKCVLCKAESIVYATDDKIFNIIVPIPDSNSFFLKIDIETKSIIVYKKFDTSKNSDLIINLSIKTFNYSEDDEIPQIIKAIKNNFHLL